MNWNDLRFFLYLARLKRMSHVARKLGVDRATVAARIAELENALDCRLFESTSGGYALTEPGRHLLQHAETVENTLELVPEAVRGEEARVSGTVRIGTPEGFGSFFLAPRLKHLLEQHPDLDVEILALPRFASLAAREADILVTIDRPEHGRYVMTRLTDYTYGLFASKEYLKRHGAVRRASQLAEHRLIGYIDELLPSPQLRHLESLLPKTRLRIASTGMLAQLKAVEAGAGLGVLAHFLVDDCDLQRVLPGEAIWRRTFWIATHADWYKLRRIRAVWDFLRQIVEAQQALFVAS